MAASSSLSSAATSSTSLGTLAGVAWNPITWDPSIFDRGHRFLDAIKDKQLAFITSFNQVREHHEIAKSQLGEVRLAVEKERQELSRLREETRLAREALDEAAMPVIPEEELYQRLEAQRAELQETLDSLVAAQAEAKKEHTKVLTAAQARIDETSDLIGKYLGEVWGLRVKLEVQTKATADAVTVTARQEVELNSAKDRRARLETELATVREELVKTGEDNAAKAAELSSQASLLRKAKQALHLARTNHGMLIGQRELETKKLLGIAQSLRDLLSWFELRAVRVDGTDVSTLIPSFSDLVGKLSVLDVWISKFCNEEIANCAREVAGMILSRVYLRHPEFPFETLLDAWLDSEDAPTHCQAVSGFVDEVVERM